jgi:GH15 family glucan-1,4-alpha-glucosidase
MMRAWSDRCPAVGRWTELKRSLLTLKGLTYEPIGGIVAAATTSLPEREAGRYGMIGSAGYATPPSLCLLS